MPSEIMSTARPSPLRLVGFAAMAGGGLLLGLGALLDWAVLSFPPEIDPSGISAAPIRGVDVWEGMVVLGAAIAILVATVATRVTAPTARRRIAWSIVAIALVAAGIALSAAVRADERFVATDGLDAYAQAIADDLGLPVERVREDLEAQLRDALDVERGPGSWLTPAGGVAAAAGGVLTVRWLRRRAAGSPEGAVVEHPGDRFVQPPIDRAASD